MRENPFDSCWDRLDRVSSHRVALAEIWNEFIADGWRLTARPRV